VQILFSYTELCDMVNKYGELLKLLQQSIYIDTEKFASNYKLYICYI